MSGEFSALTITPSSRMHLANVRQLFYCIVSVLIYKIFIHSFNSPELLPVALSGAVVRGCGHLLIATRRVSSAMLVVHVETGGAAVVQAPARARLEPRRRPRGGAAAGRSPGSVRRLAADEPRLPTVDGGVVTAARRRGVVSLRGRDAVVAVITRPHGRLITALLADTDDHPPC